MIISNQWRIQDLKVGGRGLCQWGGSLKVWTVELKVILGSFGHISITIMLTINRERSERRTK